MSKTGVLLLVSLAFNAFLLVLFAAPLVSSGNAPPASRPAAAAARPAVANESGTPGFDARPTRPTAHDDPGTSSREAAGKNTSFAASVDDVITTLRRTGVDEATLRKLAAAYIEQSFVQRARELLATSAPEQYWQTLDARGYGVLDAEKLAAYQQLRRERLAALRKVLGEEARLHSRLDSPYTYAAPDLQDLNYLPPEKRLAVLEYMENFNREMQGARTVQMRLGRTQDIDAKREEGIRDILGAELYEEYFRRSSGAAITLRHELAAFQPSKAEFDALLAVEREYGQRYGMPPMDAAAQAKVQERLARRDEAIREALGEQRHADYERATDFAYRNLEQLARELNLDADAAQRSWAHIERARAKVRGLGKAPDMRDPAVGRTLQGIRSELKDALTRELGLEEYTEVERDMLLGPSLNVGAGRSSRGLFYRGS